MVMNISFYKKTNLKPQKSNFNSKITMEINLSVITNHETISKYEGDANKAGSFIIKSFTTSLKSQCSITNTNFLFAIF